MPNLTCRNAKSPAFSQNRPTTFVTALQRVATARKSRNQLSRNFRRRSIFDFCNTIGTKPTWHDVRLRSVVAPNRTSIGAATVRISAPFTVVSPLGTNRDAVCCGAWVCCWPILLQKSFGADERNFLGPLTRFVRRDVRDHIAYQKNDHGVPYRPFGALQRQRCREIIFRVIFEAVRFSTFATLSTHKGHQRTGAAADDYAALATRPSISVRSATKSMGFVRSASAPPSKAFLLVLSSP